MRTAEQAQLQLKQGLRVTWVGMFVNILLIGVKIVAGVLGRSQALIADGVHSISDLVSDVIVLLGLRWGRKGEDEDHQFGHARIETIAAMLTGIILILIGFGLAWSAILSIYEHESSHPGRLAIAAAFFSIVLKEAMYWYTIRIGRRIRSKALIGNAWHHRSDALSSIAVLIGVTGAYLNPDWSLADAVATLVVTFFIFRVGGTLTWSAMKEVVDTAPDPETLKKIMSYASAVEGVHQVHDIRARYVGSSIQVELHIVVDPDLTVREGHAIAKEVEKQVLKNVVDVERTIIHVDPEPKESASTD
ncbi:MAG TPA: cation diffusion facilitator family transporter [candidate division Zixibacteria bacterium]|nr:cation diffusion facilitator family transporter [candidate division Zixibacteria bacterium]